MLVNGYMLLERWDIDERLCFHNAFLHAHARGKCEHVALQKQNACGEEAFTFSTIAV
jgi:hypothetical protein